MAEWLSIIGIGEDGMTGLREPALQALSRAQAVFGGPRHLAMITHPDKRAWPVPFDLGPLLALRGQNVAMLVSGDPFWFGAGSSVAAYLGPDEWQTFPQVSCFSMIAAHLGWRLEEVPCLGLHARALSALRPHLTQGARVMLTLRDGQACGELADYLAIMGWGDSTLHIFEAMGGPHERRITVRASDWGSPSESQLVAAAVEVQGTGQPLGCASGRADDLFENDGQITKRPIRALALSALAPRPGELLWDIGAGSGSIGIEWMLAHPRCRAIAIEQDGTRLARARTNARALGAIDLDLRLGRALDLLADLPSPNAVFIGGGADQALLEALWQRVRPGTRIVAHAVTLETEALLGAWHQTKGGTLLRIDLAEAQPLGIRRGWRAAFPVLQWSVQR